MSENQGNNKNEKIKSSAIIVHGLFEIFLAGWQACQGSEPVDTKKVMEHFQAFFKSEFKKLGQSVPEQLNIKWVDLSPRKPSNS